MLSSALQAKWAAPSHVHALTTLRAPAGASEAPFDRFNLGDQCGDAPGVVATNREALRQEMNLPQSPRWLRQVHGSTVARIQKRAPDGLIEADAAVTSERNVVLAVLTADCLPVVLSSRCGDEVAVAHAGWRGLAQGVLEATVKSMSTPPDEIMVWLGPAAGPARYEVGKEVRSAFVAADPAAAEAFVLTRNQHWNVDLFALARRRLRAIGVNSIDGGGICTISNPHRFFSHRRDGVTGRMATLVWVSGA